MIHCVKAVSAVWLLVRSDPWPGSCSVLRTGYRIDVIASLCLCRSTAPVACSCSEQKGKKAGKDPHSLLAEFLTIPAVCILIASVYFFSSPKNRFFPLHFHPSSYSTYTMQKVSWTLSLLPTHRIPSRCLESIHRKIAEEKPKGEFYFTRWMMRYEGSWLMPSIIPPPPIFFQAQFQRKISTGNFIPCELGMCGKFVLIFAWRRCLLQALGASRWFPALFLCVHYPCVYRLISPSAHIAPRRRFSRFFPPCLEWIVRRIVRIAHGRTKNRRKSRTPLLDALVGLCWGGGDGEKKARRIK